LVVSNVFEETMFGGLSFLCPFYFVFIFYFFSGFVLLSYC